MLAALKLIETFRAKGEPLTGGVFRVCWDAALECGAKLRVTSNRTVNVRKGNRPHRPRQMTIDHPPGEIFYQFVQAPTVTEPAGRTEVYDNREWRAALDEQDRIDAEGLAAAINAPPLTTWATWGADPWTEREWDSERIFREMANDGPPTITMTGTPFDIRDGDWLQVGTQHFGAGELREWARIADVDPARRTITLRATTTESPAMYLRRRAKRAPDPRAKPSRVPEKFQRTRLDGRRSR